MSRPDIAAFDRLAVSYDRGMAPLERLWLREMRTELLAHAEGAVLEVGVGTGANLPYYSESVCLSAVDESAEMLTIASRRAGELRGTVRLCQADIEQLPFPSNCFDTVVVSLVLCSVVNQLQALNELWRVLRKPGGRLLLLEHMRPKSRPLAWFVDRASVPWCALNGRCHLNRDTQQAIEVLGFRIEKVESRLGGFLKKIIAVVPERHASLSPHRSQRQDDQSAGIV